MLFTVMRAGDNQNDGFSIPADEAFIKYSDMVLRLACQRVNGNFSDAQDIMCEVFYRLVKRKPDIESDEHMKAWLIRVTINCSNSLLSSAWHKKTCTLSETIPAQNGVTGEDLTVYNAVMSLPKNIKTAIHLFYYEDLSVEEIAEAMSANENTVKSWLRRGRERLKVILSEQID